MILSRSQEVASVRQPKGCRRWHRFLIAKKVLDRLQTRFLKIKRRFKILIVFISEHDEKQRTL